MCRSHRVQRSSEVSGYSRRGRRLAARARARSLRSSCTASQSATLTQGGQSAVT